MRLILFFLIVGTLWGAFMLIVRIRRRVRRRNALNQPFSDEWVKILEKNLPPYARLSPVLRHELHQDMKIFLSEKSFEGCGGLALTDEIRVYPSTYVAGGSSLFRHKSGQKSVRLGESWTHGTVVLSWDSIKHGAFNFSDGHNVTLHEFAHQLDQEEDSGDGAPILGDRSAYTSWAKIFSKEFTRLQVKNCAAGNRTDTDIEQLERIISAADGMTMAEADMRLHHVIARASGNVLYVLLLNAFTTQMNDYYALYFRNPDNIEETRQFHKDICAAIKNRKPDTAKRVMQDVLSSAAKKSIQMISA